MASKELLSKKLTYDEFCEIASSAWLLAEEQSRHSPTPAFRIGFFQAIEDGVAGKPNKYSMDSLIGGGDAQPPSPTS